MFNIDSLKTKNPKQSIDNQEVLTSPCLPFSEKKNPGYLITVKTWK